MSGAALTGFHAQAMRLSALANSITTPESEEDVRQDGALPASEYTLHHGDEAADMQDSSEADSAYRAKTDAFDAGADIWAMLSVIQRD